MRFLTTAECRDWCKQRDLPTDDNSRIARNGFPFSVTTKVPEESRRHAILSRYLIENLREWDSCLLWVTTWGVWPTEESGSVYAHLRSGYGDNRPLVEAPGHLFDQTEKEDAVGFLRLVFTFGWDAYVIPSNTSLIFFASHDEFVDLFTADKQMLESAEKGLVCIEEEWYGKPPTGKRTS